MLYQLWLVPIAWNISTRKFLLILSITISSGSSIIVYSMFQGKKLPGLFSWSIIMLF
jgi:hypothetical protein